MMRMALEILLFRSLFRNTKAELRKGPRLVFEESKFLWLGALAFHWSFLLIFLRHLRFFLEPVPGMVLAARAPVVEGNTIKLWYGGFCLPHDSDDPGQASAMPIAWG